MKKTPAQQRARIEHRLTVLRKEIVQRQETIEVLLGQLEQLTTPTRSNHA